MWVQIIKRRIKAGADEEWRQGLDEIGKMVADHRPEWRRTITLQNQNDPQEYYNIVFFESEETAHQSEQTFEQQERMRHINSLAEGTPEFVDCAFVSEQAR